MSLHPSHLSGYRIRPGSNLVIGADPGAQPHHHHFWFTVQDLATGQLKPWTYAGVSTFTEAPALIIAKASEMGLDGSSWRIGMILHQRVD